jgi:acyl carrier protein
MTRDEKAASIRAKVIELAREIGRDATALTNDDVIPRTGFLDSSAIMGLIAWYEVTFNLDIPQEAVTVENFGTVNDMVNYAERHRS